jgi:hypothetical protein
MANWLASDLRSAKIFHPAVKNICPADRLRRRELLYKYLLLSRFVAGWRPSGGRLKTGIDMIGLVFYNAFIDGGAAMSSGRGRFSASV